MENAITRFFLIVLIILSVSFDFYIFVPFILGIYFIFDKSWWNLVVLVIYFVIFLFSLNIFNFVFYSSLALLIIIFLSNYFSRQKDDSSDDMDFSKLLGNMG